MKPKKPTTRTKKKRPYKKPVLKTHGDFRALTATKGGAMMDGGGKPGTRVGGAEA